VKILRQILSVYKEELVKFWQSSACGSGSRNFLKGFNIVR